jgi:hypothetical protein
VGQLQCHAVRVKTRTARHAAGALLYFSEDPVSSIFLNSLPTASSRRMGLQEKGCVGSTKLHHYSVKCCFKRHYHPSYGTTARVGPWPPKTSASKHFYFGRSVSNFVCIWVNWQHLPLPHRPIFSWAFQLVVYRWTLLQGLSLGYGPRVKRHYSVRKFSMKRALTFSPRHTLEKSIVKKLLFVQSYISCYFTTHMHRRIHCLKKDCALFWASTGFVISFLGRSS